MHRLFLLRHAAAGWAPPGLSDFDRPLTGKGRADATAVGRLMRERGYLPDLVLCSSSARTRQTWSCVAAGLGAADGAGIRLITSEAIYNGDASTLLDLIRNAPAAGAMLVVGHNPTMAELAAAIPGGGDGGALRAAAGGFPKAALAVIATGEPLSHLAKGSGTLEAFLRT
jgi:phosphohistidine phosphatase